MSPLSKEEEVLNALKAANYFAITDNGAKTQIRNDLAVKFKVEAVWIKDVVVNNYGKAGRRISNERVMELFPSIPTASISIQKEDEDPAEGVARFSGGFRPVRFVSAAPNQYAIGAGKLIEAKIDDPSLVGLVILNNGQNGALADGEFLRLQSILAAMGLFAAAVHSAGVSHAAPSEAVQNDHQAPAQTNGDFAAVCEALIEDLKRAGYANPVFSQFARMIASLAAKNFLILTGLSGSGKTQLAHALARWMTPDSKNDDSAFVRVVPVGADWTGSDKMLGYPDALVPDSYVSTPVLDLVLHAIDRPDVPHFLILDEMNLSHVERYFADFLSAIESRAPVPLHSDAHRIRDGVKVPKSISLPGNLFVVGTVNVDETTYMFSPKVLDRANVIEFRIDAKEMNDFILAPTRPFPISLAGRGERFSGELLRLSASPISLSTSQLKVFSGEMRLLFELLHAHGSEFGYRVAFEASRFVAAYEAMSEGKAISLSGRAMDFVIAQKILPKLHGSRAKLGPVLKLLWFVCVNGPDARGDEPSKAAEAASRSSEREFEPNIAASAGAFYPVSANKIARMWRALAENGFTSFSE